MAEIAPTLTHNDYTVGWICALPETELVAARAMLDEEHPMLPAADLGDTNSYCLGRIGNHNVVIACLPAEKTGTASAATVAKDMLRSFKKVRFGLMVGIGGGVPLKDNTKNEGFDNDSEDSSDDDNAQNSSDVRLGDVVISLQSKSSDAVIQYNFGKSEQGGEFVRTGRLNKPPNILLSSVAMLQGEHKLRGHKLSDHLSKMIKDYPNLAREFQYPASHKDRAFKSTVTHIVGKKSCKACCGPQDANLIHRKHRESSSPVLHYGTIGSADQVMKDAVLRDRWARDEGILCFEMEAAGLVDTFPCLVIRGICDYADSHKNKTWQPYAAATAAAFAKEFLHFVSPQRVLQEKTILEVSDPALQKEVSQISVTVREQTEKQEFRHMSNQQRACHQLFKSSTYEEFKNNNPERVPGTCIWVLQNPQYIQWLESRKNDLLWISADPGCGKSVLSRSLVENELCSTDSQTVCYFFFKDNEQQDRLAVALCALLHQLFATQPQLIKHSMPAWEKNGEKLRDEIGELWRILINAATHQDSHNVFCVLDALDECRERDRQTLLGFLSKFYSESSSQTTRKTSLKFLVTSRPYDDIESGFQQIPADLPTIRLSGEKENDKIHEEIDLVIRERVATLACNNQLSRPKTEMLEQWLVRMENRTYLWLHLAIKGIEENYKNSLRPNSESIESLQLPSSIYDAYEKILGNVKEENKNTVTTILHIIVGARRPLIIDEMAIALGLATCPNPQSYAEAKIDKDRVEELLRRLCGLFVFINHSRIYLIHQTAKEFLIQKDSYAGNNCWKHCLKPNDSETIMARICIDYLSLTELESIELKEEQIQLKKSPRQSMTREDNQNDICSLQALLEYSAEHWPNHFRSATVSGNSPVLAKVCSLYEVRGNRFKLWFPLLWRAQRPYEKQPEMNNIRLAAFNGHDEVLRVFLNGPSINLEAKDYAKRTALIWAAELGYEAVVKLLLDKQANVNAQGGLYSIVLQVASRGGHEAVVKLLLDKQANVSAQGGIYGNALQVASWGGHTAVVKLLLDKQANVNAQGGFYGNALQAASWGGHEAVIKLLLNKQANINAQGGEYGNALQAASQGGHEAVVKLLLDKQANVNAQGGFYGNALQAASQGGHEAVVKLLLDKQANVNAQGGIYGNALQAALWGGHKAVVKLLLDKQANINAQGGRYSNALQAASERGHEAVVKLLLDKQANVNAQDQDERTRPLPEKIKVVNLAVSTHESSPCPKTNKRPRPEDSDVEE